MATISVSLSESMRLFIEQQAARRGFDDSAKYLRTLIREEQKRRAKEELEAKLLEGLDSPSTPWTKDDGPDLLRRFNARHARKPKVR